MSQRFAEGMPIAPDFDAIDRASPVTADRRTTILALIGNLVYAWSNNETMLIYLIQYLMRTDETSAATVYATLNTSRARMDLVQRLARINLADEALLARVASTLKRLSLCAQIRNEFNHCMYEVDAAGSITHTRSMRMVEKNGRPSLGERMALDDAKIAKVTRTTRQLQAINRDLWSLLPDLHRAMQEERS
jgi:hypothetical protein